MQYFFFFNDFMTLATAKACANEFCNLIVESQETGLKGNIKRTSGPSLAPRQEQLHNVILDRCLPNIWMKRCSLLFVFNMLPGKLTEVPSFCFTKAMTSHPHSLPLSFLTSQAALIFSGFDFLPFWGWEVLIYLVIAHTYAWLWKYWCRALVSPIQ